MNSGTQYDCIIVGGGHNGLVAAAYLAKSGKSVCVLERRHVLGGCATTEELWPGYRISTAAYVISLFRPEIMADLKPHRNIFYSKTYPGPNCACSRCPSETALKS